MTLNRKDFLIWEQFSRDTIDVKRVYIDIAGDLTSGVLLSQIIYWHLPDKKGNISKKRVYRDGHYWLVKRDGDWWEEARLKRSTARRAMKKLENQKLIITMVRKFSGAPTKHIRLNWDVFLSVLDSFLEETALGFDQNE